MEKLTEADIEELDIEFFLEREGIAHKIGRGSSGIQAQLRTCPSCGDDRWRTYFGLESGFGNCFLCEARWNKVSLIRAHLGGEEVPWHTTFEFIRELLREQGWRPKRKAMVAVNVEAVKLPISEPITDQTPAARDYLAQRSITLELADYFQLRHCAFGWWTFKDGEETKVQNFQDRVIIPVFDLDGELKTFQGRDMTGHASRKYLFPMGLPGTGRYLLNGHNCVLARHACMGEGIFDVVAIKMALDEDPDLRDVIPLGSFGKHLSSGDMKGDDQLGRFITLKNRGLETVTIMWDGEARALEAALDAARKLVAVGLKVRIALLPFDKDPNEVLPEVVRSAYRNARNYTPALDMTLRLRNPYASAAQRAHYGV